MPVIRRRLAASIAPSPKIEPQDCYKRGYNVHEGAKYVEISVWQIRQWIHSGDLRPAAIGKHILDQAAIDRLLDGLFKSA